MACFAAFRIAVPAAVLWIALWAGAASAAAPEAAPQRIVSLNLCADQLVVLLVERERIAALSELADSPSLSYVADRVAGIPRTAGTAEEVLPLRPDLVMAGRYTAKPAVALLRAKGVPVLLLDIPRDFAAIRDQVRRVAQALGAEPRAEDLLAAMDRTLSEGAEGVDAGPRGRRPVAVTLQAGGFTAGAGTLPDAVLDAAGLDNLATRSGLTGYGYLALETVVAGRPDLLIAETAMPDRPSLRQALLMHPALARSGAVGRRVDIPPPLLSCGAPFTAEAVRLLRQAAAAP
ncbi:ABC transporter substrate-binding protein, partial [Azospirillum halopraeferens]|uniref:ABC transporter substrate-binding protein n=1 Tax=Azospirillum halopraeferens TaxID=34010 RepID=UPI00040CE732